MAGEELPGAVLFVCSLNAVRSPMAAALMRVWNRAAGNGTAEQESGDHRQPDPDRQPPIQTRHASRDAGRPRLGFLN